MNAYELAETMVLARRIASRLEAAGGDDYLCRLARAQALDLCDTLRQLAEGGGRPWERRLSAAGREGPPPHCR
jgi:hypothetical protein